jgi:hydrogenase maturation protein HypF
MNATSTTEASVAQRILLSGHVQGIGYRPALARLASELGLVGWVRNTSQGIEVHAEGPDSQVEKFIEQCLDRRPAHGVVTSKKNYDVGVEHLSDFRILHGSNPFLQIWLSVDNAWRKYATLRIDAMAIF